MAEDIDICGVQLKAGGVGIDLTRARYAIYYSLDFALGDYDQSRKRVHRPGQTRPTIYVPLIAEDTILDGPRRYVTGKLDAKWELFIECPYCAGFWIGVVWWVAWLIWPYETLLVAVPWAISAGVIGASKILSPD